MILTAMIIRCGIGKRVMPAIFCTIICSLPGLAYANTTQDTTDVSSVNQALINSARWRTRSHNESVSKTLYPADKTLNLQNAWSELADVIADRESIRWVTILGRNDIVNIADLLFLQGADSTLIRADAIEFVKRQNQFPGITRVINTLARIGQQKIIVLTRSNITNIEQLKGKTIASDIKGSSAFVSASVLLQTLGIDNVTHLDLPTNKAVDEFRNGDADVLVYLQSMHPEKSPTNAKSSHPVESIGKDDQFNVLSIPLDTRLANVYSPATLTKDDLPKLLEQNQEVPTAAVQVILAAYRWNPRQPRYTMGARFAESFMESAQTLKKGPNALQWADLDFSFAVPGIPQINTVRSILARQKAALAAKQEVARTQQQALLDSKRQELNELQLQIETRISEQLGYAYDANLERLQEISKRLEVIATQLSAIDEQN